MTPLRSWKSFLLSTLGILAIGFSFIVLPLNNNLIITSAIAAPLTQNPNPECPPNSDSIWVQINNPDFKFSGEPDRIESLPFDSGYIEIGGHKYVNYLLGVLIQESGTASDFNPVDDETLKAVAIAARTVVYKNCGLVSFNGHPGMDDSDKQGYNPKKSEDWFYNQQALFTRYQQAIDATDDIYLTFNGSVFDVQYRDISKNPTNGEAAPHLSVDDPAGDYHSNEQSKTGLPKKKRQPLGYWRKSRLSSYTMEVSSNSHSLLHRHPSL